MIYNYCNSENTESLKLSCKPSDLKKVNSYTLHDDTLQIEIFVCEKCNGQWKKTVFNNITKWLKVGDVTRNYYVKQDAADYYPVENFTIEEAYKFDNSILCGPPEETRNYQGLSCSPKTLKLIEKTEDHEAIGYRYKVEIFVCSKCYTKWEISEEFDSHHGYTSKAVII